jgi:hypothetical protein
MERLKVIIKKPEGKSDVTFYDVIKNEGHSDGNEGTFIATNRFKSITVHKENYRWYHKPEEITIGKYEHSLIPSISYWDVFVGYHKEMRNLVVVYYKFLGDAKRIFKDKYNALEKTRLSFVKQPNDKRKKAKLLRVCYKQAVLFGVNKLLKTA